MPSKVLISLRDVPLRPLVIRRRLLKTNIPHHSPRKTVICPTAHHRRATVTTLPKLPRPRNPPRLPPRRPPICTRPPRVRWPSEALSNGVEGNGAEIQASAGAAGLDADETEPTSQELEATALSDGQVHDELDNEELGDDETYDDDLEDELDDDFDWDRMDEIHDAQCRYVGADVVPDPEERREADRLVRLMLAEKRLAAERLRGRTESSLTPHPLNRLAAIAGSDASRNPLSDMDLRQHPSARTTAETTQGRCTNGPEMTVCTGIPAAATAATSG